MEAALRLGRLLFRRLAASFAAFAVTGLAAFAVTGLAAFAVTGLAAFAVTGLAAFAVTGLAAFAVTGLAAFAVTALAAFVAGRRGEGGNGTTYYLARRLGVTGVCYRPGWRPVRR